MKLRLTLISLSLFLILSPVSIRFWSLAEESLIREPLSFSKIQLISPTPLSRFDFGSEQDCLDDSDDSIKIVDCQSKLVKWQSPEPWRVTETITGDLNRDGSNELAMVVWREHKRWPIDSFLPSGGRIANFHDQAGMSCHLILVGWDGSQYREMWAGSSLIAPVFNIQAVDLDQDGFQELVALEGDYDDNQITGNLTVWDWSGFGFRLRDSIKEGISDFGIVSVNQNVLIVTD
ncbi:MAG: hypothetical protein CVU42_09365 [Chloroflexi bacterium HGW-Chloroflexi-4]|jgi:hypothetical protein|nr:MAG: hypothetical protein CVU42_09365 [Chloroflexi bacterium HGW-Chloroflexi-4]